MKKRILKLKYVGFWDGFDEENNIATNALKKRYEVCLCDDPDFIIASVFGKDPYEYLKYDCVRILYSGEPYSPDFNIFDYAIGFDNLYMGDRYYRCPLAFLQDYSRVALSPPDKNTAINALREKKRFCNFIYGHESYQGKREELLDAIMSYKRVDCAGVYRNNMPSGKLVSRGEKCEFLYESKFTIAAESVSYPGFVTEKLIDSYYSLSIPIYYGNPDIEKEFCPESMVRWDGTKSGLDVVVNKITELDNNDELYLKMIMADRTVEDNYYNQVIEGASNFLFKIFDQPKEAAYRRLRAYSPLLHEKRLAEYYELKNESILHENNSHRVSRLIIKKTYRNLSTIIKKLSGKIGD